MDGKKARKNARTPQTEDEEKTTDGAKDHKAHGGGGLMRSMRKLMKNKKKSDKSKSSSGSTTTTGSSSSRHHLVSEFTRARPHKETTPKPGEKNALTGNEVSEFTRARPHKETTPKPGEKVDVKDLHGAPPLVAMPGVPGPTPPPPSKSIPQPTMMAFTVFENDPAAKGAGTGEKLAVCRPDKDAKLQWQSAEAERAASREHSREDVTDEEHARTTTTPDERTPVKKKSKQRNKTLDSQHPTNREKAKTPMKGGRTPVTAKGRTPARTPVSPF